MKEDINYDYFDIINKNEKKNILDELNISILYDKENSILIMIILILLIKMKRKIF